MRTPDASCVYKILSSDVKCLCYIFLKFAVSVNYVGQSIFRKGGF